MREFLGLPGDERNRGWYQRHRHIERANASALSAYLDAAATVQALSRNRSLSDRGIFPTSRAR